MTIKELWLLLRNKPVKFLFANMSMQNYPEGDPTEKRRETVTIFVPDGYADAKEFLKDCQFERVPLTRS